MKLLRKKILWITVFIVYLICLSYMVFFAEALGRDTTREYSYNLKLFSEIRRFIVYRHILGTKAVILNLAGNIVAFMPFGMLLPRIHRYCHHLIFVVLSSFLLSLAIELVQLFTKVGSFDVDDLLLNTIGGFLGYVCLVICERIIRLLERKNLSGNSK